MVFRTSLWIPLGLVYIVSTAVYVRLLYVVATRRRAHYSSFFFKMCLSQGVIDMACMTSMIIVNLTQTDQIFGAAYYLSLNGPIIPDLMYFYIYYFLFAQVLGITVISINRCTMVAAPNSKFAKIFDWPSRLFVFIVHILIPFPFIIHMFFQPKIVIIVSNTTGIPAASINLNAVSTNTLEAMIVTSLCSITCLLCYIIIVRKLSTNLVIAEVSSSIRRRRDLALTVVGFALFICLCIITAYYVFVNIASGAGNTTAVASARNIYIFTVFLISYINPWMLLVTNRATRRRFFGLRGGDSSVPGPSSVMYRNNTH